jgi:hypothetical protein
MSLREPFLHSTPIFSLRPTQITLGIYEVRQKRGVCAVAVRGEKAKERKAVKDCASIGSTAENPVGGEGSLPLESL